jgi:hypothetical protein
MSLSLNLRLSIFILLLLNCESVFAICRILERCRDNSEIDASRSSSNPSYPTTSSRISSNPSAVPIHEGFGLEGLYFGGTTDFIVVKGLGRVGAAISPSNAEESFFGSPVQEIPEKFSRRKLLHKKYESQKTNVAMAFGLYDNKKSELSQVNLNFGLIGRYNKLTKVFMSGVGISGALGPFTFGYSLSGDQTQLDFATQYGLPNQVIVYGIESYSLGLFYSSIAIDYSTLKLSHTELTTVNVTTVTVLLNKWILTTSLRKESSARLAYDYKTYGFISAHNKFNHFYGAQYSAGDNFMVGAFINYYLLNELSFGLTWFI